MRIDPTPFLRALLDRKLLEGPLTSALLEGNVDRRPDLARCHLRVEDARGKKVKLTLGRDLTPLRARADAFHQALPAISPASVFFVSLGTGDAWAQEWIEGATIEESLGDVEYLSTALLQLASLEHALDGSAEPSSLDAWETEFARWAGIFLELNLWTAEERKALSATLLPALREQLRPAAFKRRWSNGDFISSNVRLSRSGPVLLDFEHAEKTHFFAEDQVRFRRLSPSAHQHPGLFNGVWPPPHAAWEMFFQLRQLALDLATNTPQYLAREIPRRKAHLRSAFEAAGLRVPEWSVAAATIPPEFAEETVQLFWSADGAWTEADSQRVAIRRGVPQWAAFRLPSHARRLRLDPTASSRSASIETICALTAEGDASDMLPEVTAAGAEVRALPPRLEVFPSASDAQLFIDLSHEARLLLVEQTIEEKSPAAASQLSHHLENARWCRGQNCAIEFAGWCFSPTTRIAQIEACVDRTVIAQIATHARPDVAQHHGGNPFALGSGFKIGLPLLELETQVELRAVTDRDERISFHTVRAGDLPGRDAVMLDYPGWAATRKGAAAIASPFCADGPTPLVSLLLPVFNTPPSFLRECLESVAQQIYPHWELRIVDDGSTHSEVPRLLAQFAKQDPRIHVETLPQNRGISHATNHALAAAQGEFVGCLDHDDRLHPQALLAVVARFSATKAAAVYTDEEKITAGGEACVGVFKPDFSPEFFRGVMYVGHFLCVRRDLALAVGGFDARFDGIQDFEFALRVSEQASAIEHVPEILYQWRMSPSSSAQSGNVKGNMDELQLAAVQAHLARLGRHVGVQSLGAHRLWLLPTSPQNAVSFALIARDTACLDQIQNFAQGGAAFVLHEASLLELRRVLQATAGERIIWFNEPVSPNSAAALEQLAGFLEDAAVGAAAPVLLAADGKVFAAGAIVTAAGEIVPAMRGFSRESDGYNGSLVCNREVSSVLSSCVALRKTELLAVLNERAHPFSDTGMIELCLALQRRGQRILSCGALQFGTQRDWANQGVLGHVTGSWRDPYYNPSLDEAKGDYRLRDFRAGPTTTKPEREK